MGGVGGHMMHLYDNPLLTFSEMREIFDLAAAGALKGTEKTDGQNLFISYSIKDGKAKAARNKSNIKAGGLTATELAEKFAGRGSLEKTFVESFEAFERVAQRLNPEQQESIFGPDTNIYYSAEVLDPRSVNVISYDTKSLVIHRSASEFDRDTGSPTDRDVSGNITFLSDALENEQENMAQDDYGVQLDAIQDLQEFLDQEFLQETQSRLTDLLREQSISDDQTILDFMISKIKKTLYNEYNLTENISREVLKYIITSNSIIKDKYNITRRASKNNIAKLAQNPEEAKNATDAMNNTKEIMSDSLMGLEDIVHDFSVEAVRGLRSLFILDDKQEKEMLRLRKETERAITAIENSGNEEAMSILQKQMKKLKSLENINTASEGFVFDYDGSTYKFTGNFAPMNQLLGLFKYGRGSVPPLEKLDDKKPYNPSLQAQGRMKLREDDLAQEVMNSLLNEFSINDDPGYTMPRKKKDQVIALFPGAFRPPTRGHLFAATSLMNQADIMKILISSPKSESSKRRVGTKEVTPEISKKIWELYGIPSENVQITDSPSPVRAVFEFLEDPMLAPPGTTIMLGCSTKGGDEARWDNAAAYAKKVRGDEIKVVTSACPPERHTDDYEELLSALEDFVRNNLPSIQKGKDPMNIHGSDMRHLALMALEGDQELTNLFKHFLPSNIDHEGVLKLLSSGPSKEVREVFSFPFLDALVEEVMDEIKLKKSKQQKPEPEEEELEEMSTAGGSGGANGSVEGSPRRGMGKRDSNTIIRQ